MGHLIGVIERCRLTVLRACVRVGGGDNRVFLHTSP